MSRVTVFRCALAAIMFVLLFALGAMVADAPMPSDRRAGIRGLKRQQALARGDAWSYVEPLVRWLGARVRGVAGEQLLRSLDRQIRMAGDCLGLLPEELLALSLLGAGAGALAGIAAGAAVKMGPTVVLAVAAFGAVTPILAISSAAAERLKAIERRLPAAVELLALAMGAGLDFAGALRQTVDRSGTPDDPLIEELAVILLGLSLGRTRREALEELAERAPIPIVQELVGALVQAELRGNPVVDVLQIQAEVSRQKRSVLGEEAAAKAAVKMIAPLMLLFLAVLVLIVGPIVVQLRSHGF